MGSWPVSVAAGRKLVQGPPFSGAQSAPASTDLKPPPLDLRCNDDAHHASWTLKEWRTDPRMSPHFPPIGPVQPVGKGVPALDRRPPVPAVPRRGTSRVDAPACQSPRQASPTPRPPWASSWNDGFALTQQDFSPKTGVGEERHARPGASPGAGSCEAVVAHRPRTWRGAAHRSRHAW